MGKLLNCFAALFGVCFTQDAQFLFPSAITISTRVQGRREAPLKNTTPKVKGRWQNRAWKGTKPSSPPQDVTLYLGQQMQISRSIRNQNIRLINFHSHTRYTKRTILPCWNMNPTHTHTLMQAARRSIHSAKQRPTKNMQSVRFRSVQENRLFFTTALRIYDCSRLYFGGKKKKRQRTDGS